MKSFYQDYQKGLYQSVYDELLDMKEDVYEDPFLYAEAQFVMRDIMRNVRFNVELLLSHLHQLNYQFRKGSPWEHSSSEEQIRLEKEFPIFQPPTPEMLQNIGELERMTGPLPMSLKYFFEEVGCVNLIGLFPSQERSYGCVLDPLCIDSVEAALRMVTSLKETSIGDLWVEDPLLVLSGDRYHKYGYSGTSAYQMLLPSKSFDTFLLEEPHDTTFVNYLRICIRWGGFPGLEQDNRLSPEQFISLTQGLRSF